ncbi:MAG: aminomethyl-transferring glycine dehydrogenase subunit GcvPA [Fibrobacterota bacterium]
MISFPYIPNTPEDIKEMLSVCGVKSIDDFFDCIPEDLKAPELNIPGPKSEESVRREMRRLAKENKYRGGEMSFLGGGAYNHYIPSAVDYVSSRGKFFTAYTPYQPEASQGTLQSIFEYQSMMCMLTGMDVSNAGMYDGATALAEAVLMACGVKRKNRAVICGSVNPVYRSVLNTYCGKFGIETLTVPHLGGKSDTEKIIAAVDSETAAVIMPNPTFFGCIQDLTESAAEIKKKGPLFISVFYPVSLGILKTPGETGADIAVGEGQCLGNHLNFGGPYLGIFTASSRFMRKMPGRIAGYTEDKDGNGGYVLTLQTREQHIRREKATSNICSNQALCALRTSVYLSLLGSEGFVRLASVNMKKAGYCYEKLCNETSLEPVFDGPFFNEFVMKAAPETASAIRDLRKIGIYPGLDLGRFYPEMENHFLFAVTEMNSVSGIDSLAAQIREVSK